MRYILLIILNLPIIFLALFNIITQYKLKKISLKRLQHQFALWLIILTVLVCSFPAYNLLAGNPIFDSSQFSLFDIFQTTAIVVVIYVLNRQRQKIEQNEITIRDLHQELSIKLSEDKKTRLKSSTNK